MIRVLACAGGCLAASAAWAQTTPTPQALAAAFGARPEVESMSLSPDGTKVAIIAPDGARGAKLMIGDLVKQGVPRTIVRGSGDPDRLQGCDWTTATRLVCRVYMIIKGPQTLSFTRLIAINADGTGLKMLSARTGTDALGVNQDGGSLIDFGSADASGQVLVTRNFVPEVSTGRAGAETRTGMGVELVDTTTLARKIIESPKADAMEYVSDGHGVVRIMGTRQQLSSGYDGNHITYRYRTADDRSWRELGQLVTGAQSSEGFNPYVIDREANAVYGFERLDGRRALYRIALDGSRRKEMVFAHPEVDVSGLITVGRHRRVVGASYVTDVRTAEYFDSALQKLRASLGKALKGQPLINFIDTSSDEKTLLLFASSDVDAGRYYTFNRISRELSPILSHRPELDAIKMLPMKAVAYPAADGTQVPGYLTLPAGVASAKGLPAIVMPHGGPGARDEWGFDWLTQFFAARGYAVLQPNFRGSAGYGDAWFQKNGFQSWRTAVGDVNDAGKWLVAQGIADPQKLAIVGWSYGGYAALQSPALDPELFKAIVAIAAVTDLDALREESRNYTNFKLVDAFIGSGPHVREGSPARNAAKIKAPVLLFHGDLDRNVGVGESRLMRKRLTDAGRHVEYVEFKGLDHDLEDSAARTQMLAKVDAFLTAALAGR
jgi:dienelactone hydrolase